MKVELTNARFRNVKIRNPCPVEALNRVRNILAVFEMPAFSAWICLYGSINFNLIDIIEMIKLFNILIKVNVTRIIENLLISQVNQESCLTLNLIENHS